MGKVIFENDRMKNDTLKMLNFLENLVNNYDPKNEAEQTAHYGQKTLLLWKKTSRWQIIFIRAPLYFDDEFFGSDRGL